MGDAAGTTTIAGQERSRDDAMKIAIASGKGGTGKTTLSTNLATYMAESGPVILVDLDVEEPNSGLFVQGALLRHEPKFKMIPEWKAEDCSLCGQCQRVCNFNAVLQLGDSIMVFPELCHACYACSELCPTQSLPMIPKQMGELKHFDVHGMDFVESRLLIGEEQAVPLIKQTIHEVEDMVPPETVMIFDAPPGTSCPVIEATKDADLVLLVTEPTPFGLHDLKLAVETIRQLGVPFAVVLNKDGIGDDAVVRYCASGGIELVARIPNSRQIAEAYSAGKLLYRDIPAVKDAVEKVAAYILDNRGGKS